MMYAFVCCGGNRWQYRIWYHLLPTRRETPGLGEAENPNWRAQFVGKKLFDETTNQQLKL